MLQRLFQTNNNSAGLVARVALGVVILPHGLQKLFGLFGGFGFSATMDYFVGTGLPAAIAFLIIVAESFGALGLICGFLSRFAAFGICLIMLGAIFLVHLQHGFFMNWFGNQQSEGFEYHLLALGLGIATMIAGSGKWSLDKLITDRFFAEALLIPSPSKADKASAELISE